jgi:hypothetical protein
VNVLVRFQMARNTSNGRKGQVTGRVQVKNPITKRWVKVDTETGRIIDHKKTPGPYKGVRKK